MNGHVGNYQILYVTVVRLHGVGIQKTTKVWSFHCKIIRKKDWNSNCKTCMWACWPQNRAATTHHPSPFLFTSILLSLSNQNHLCDSNPWPSDHRSPPITTRPGLPSISLYLPLYLSIPFSVAVHLFCLFLLRGQIEIARKRENSIKEVFDWTTSAENQISNVKRASAQKMTKRNLKMKILVRWQ